MSIPERAWQVIADVRDQAPRHPQDADTWNIVEALADAGLLVGESDPGAGDTVRVLRCRVQPAIEGTVGVLRGVGEGDDGTPVYYVDIQGRGYWASEVGPTPTEEGTDDGE